MNTSHASGFLTVLEGTLRALGPSLCNLIVTKPGASVLLAVLPVFDVEHDMCGRRAYTDQFIFKPGVFKSPILLEHASVFMRPCHGLNIE